MNGFSRIGNHWSKSTSLYCWFIHVSCVVALCTKEGTTQHSQGVTTGDQSDTIGHQNAAIDDQSDTIGHQNAAIGDESDTGGRQSGTIGQRLSPYIPKKIIKKISKAIGPYMCMKPKPNQEPSSSSPSSRPPLPPRPSDASKKITAKKIGKVMVPYVCIKIKKEDDKCLWKKTVLMGEKCEPLQFSGAIFYDSEGNQTSEPPRSPRPNAIASPCPKKIEIKM